MIREVFIFLIIVAGLFNFKGEFVNRFDEAQIAYFVTAAGLMGALLIRKKNYILSYLLALCSIMFLKTCLWHQADATFMYEMTIIAASIFFIYYFVREKDFKEDVLKWLMIPSFLNAGLIIIQKFDMYALGEFLPVVGVSGFIGNASTSACYLAMTLPIVLKYKVKFSPIVIIAICLSGSFVAMVAGLISSMVYFYFQDKKVYRILMLVVLLFLTCYMLQLVVVERGVYIFTEDARMRLSTWTGTLDGISKNPILGWGVGSFESIVPKLPWSDTMYLGRYFNYQGSVVNHPHNEFLLGFWTLGMMYLVIMYLLVEKIIREFSRSYILSFSILVATFICMFGYFLTLPAWIVAITALAVYENRGGQNA